MADRLVSVNETHDLPAPVLAKLATAAQGALADSAVQPGALGTAAAAAVTDFATAAQGALADSAVQPGALGTLAGLSPTGTADGTTFLRGDNVWAAPAGGGGGLSVTDGGGAGTETGFTYADGQAFGKVRATDAAAYAYIQGKRRSLAFGYAKANTGWGEIHTEYTGSLAFGYANAKWSGTSKIRTDGRGSFAGGYSLGANYGDSEISGGNYPGAFAFGYAKSDGATAHARIMATAHGSVAMGSVRGAGVTSEIKATGYGAGAFGYALDASIVASANNAFQFGPGTNAEAVSVGVGTTMRFKGTTGAPTTPRNGDMWVDATGHVFVRTNGVSKSLSGLP